MPVNDTAKPTPADQWQEPQLVGFVIPLPSGNVARITRSEMFFALLKNGKLPNPLGDIVSKMIASNGTKSTVEDLELTPMAIPQLMAFTDEVVMQVMLEPRVEKPYIATDLSEEELAKQRDWKPSAGAISIEKMDTNDKVYIFRVALGGAADLESFRKEQKALMDDPQHGRAVQPATKRASRARKKS